MEKRSEVELRKSKTTIDYSLLDIVFQMHGVQNK